jgi:hypothetical protein
MEPSVIPSTAERPVVKTTRGVLWPHPVGATMTCVVCSHTRAHWRVKHARYGTSDADICALCFLYTSGWLVQERVRRVEQVAQAIGLKRQKPLEYVLGERGDKVWPPRLSTVKDADDVLGAIVLHDRFESLMSRRSS